MECLLRNVYLKSRKYDRLLVDLLKLLQIKRVQAEGRRCSNLKSNGFEYSLQQVSNQSTSVSSTHPHPLTPENHETK